MPKPLLEIWESLKRQAERADADALERIARSYAMTYTRVESQQQALIDQIELLQKQGAMTAQAVKRSRAYQNLISTINDELTDYSAYLRTEITTEATESAKRGFSAGNVLMIGALALALGVEAKNVPKSAVKGDMTLDFLAKYLDPDGALFARLNGLSAYHGAQIANGILEKVALGQNPLTIGKWIADAYGVGMTDAMRIMRTTQLYSYRQSNSELQRANSDVLQGSVWCAELDGLTCMSCVALHGQVFEAGAIADDHHNGRCAMLPWVKGEPNPIDQSGVDWFNQQSEATQRSMMGNSKYEAWQEGKFNFDQLTNTYQDEVFGNMRGETPLHKLLGDD